VKTRIIIFIAIYFIVSQAIYSQTKPFPQNVNYPYGYKPTNITSKLAQDEYLRWKGLFLVGCNAFYRPTTDNAANTKVEAIGFSMLVAAYEGDKTTYDGLLNFYKSKRRTKANNMMAWHVTCDSTIDQGSATDGDIDVAFSLIIAHIQWGESYLNSAKEIIQILKNSVITTCSGGITVLKGGYSLGGWGGCDLTDMSYYTPAFFRIFAQVTNDNTWDLLANSTYTILNNAANKTTGLVPDWQTALGQPGPSGWNGTYGYDACRVPWRIALDYLWNGNVTAKTWCTKVTNWARSIGTSNIKDGYNLDGTTAKTNNNSSFVGGFAVGAMCNSQTLADTFGTRMKQLTDTYWYNLTTRIVYLHVLTGNFWKPDLTTGLQISKAKTGIKLYPNPVLNNNELTVEGIKNYIKLEITSLSGNILLSRHLLFSDKITIDVSLLKKGIYILRISDDYGKSEFLKFIK
jgi:endo-1,4-beta-D-glucanase Y